MLVMQPKREKSKVTKNWKFVKQEAAIIFGLHDCFSKALASMTVKFMNFTVYMPSTRFSAFL